jgi:hypothetical protein
MRFGLLLVSVAALAACQPNEPPLSTATPAQTAITTPPGAAAPAAFNGTWTQKSVACANGVAPANPVIELRFDADGRILVTFVPFETYHDYWGPARFDPASSKLDFEVAGANNEPANLDLSGTASLSADGVLTLDGFFLGDAKDHAPPAEGPCRYEFARP